MIFLDAVVKDGDNDAGARETLPPRRQHVHVQPDPTILSHSNIHARIIIIIVVVVVVRKKYTRLAERSS